MSSVQHIKIPRLSDKAIVNAFKEIGGKYSVQTMNCSVTSIPELSSISLEDHANTLWATLVEQDSVLINSLSMNIEGFHVSYIRGGSHDEAQRSAIFDEIRFTYNSSHTTLHPEKRLDLISSLSKKLKAFEPGRAIKSGVSEEARQLEALHQSMLERLERHAEEVIKKAADTRIQMEQEHLQKMQEVEEQLKAKKDELDATHKNELDRLTTKEADLEFKLKAIDDRNNTHVRRAIREKMLFDVKERIQNFGVSESTEKKRAPVKAGIFLLCLFFLGILVVTGYDLHLFQKNSFTVALSAVAQNASTGKVEPFLNSEAPYYLLWARLALASIGFVGTLVFYTRWQNKWAEQHASSEFQLQQFNLDVNRANWVIESALEWKKETNSHVPEQLLISLTKNLFISQAEPETVLHPADELASALMGSASKVKLKIGDSELDFNKPGKIPN